MSLLVPWLAFPLVLALVTSGCGLLLARVTRVDLPAALVMPAGLAVVIVSGEFTTLTAATAGFTAPLAVAFAVAGLALSLPWRDARRVGFPLLAAGGVFAALAAPVVLSGSATFTGYIKLDDTSTWLALTDQVMLHGRSLAGLAPSWYSAVLRDYLGTGYPVGAFVPLGVGQRLVGEDGAWLFQPYLAFSGAMLALGLYSLAATLLRSSRVRAIVAFVASQPALLYGYALWGGVKEI